MIPKLVTIMMESRFRLRSSAFERPEKENQTEPRRVIFLSVEGDNTERDYFSHLQQYLQRNKKAPLIHIEVLRHRRGEGFTAPEYVLELLNEYIGIRESGVLPKNLPEAFTKKYPQDIIKTFINNPERLEPLKKSVLEEDLLKLGIDIDYRRYLETFNGPKDTFAIVIDRDKNCHTKKEIETCLNECKKNKFTCYITNPCFEFWLLLHLCNVNKIYADRLNLLLDNAKVSDEHTYTSKEVSNIAHHKKKITYGKFETYYAKNIPLAMARSCDFETDSQKIIDKLGTNLSQLFKDIGFITDLEKHGKE